MPPYELDPSASPETELAVTAVKLDGAPVPAELRLYARLAEPRVADWILQIAQHLGSVPHMYEPDNRAQLWRGRPDIALQKRLAELDPEYEPVNLHEELSEQWGHAELMLSPFNGQLGRSYDMGGSGPFGAVVFPLVLEPGRAHTLVVHHKQLPGMDVDHYSGHRTRFVALRFVLTRARMWGQAPREITIDVSVPEGWGKVAIRPPATKVVPAEGATTYRVRMSGRPLEELYIAVESPQE
jgi:hypothetical protein